MSRWADVPRAAGPARRGVGIEQVILIGLVVALALAFGAGHVTVASLLGLLALLNLQARALSPGFVRGVERIAAGLAHAVGAALLGLLGLFILPVWAALRLLRWNPLDPARSRHWSAGSRDPARWAGRTFQLERPPRSVPRRLHGAVAGLAAVASLGLVTLGAVGLVHDVSWPTLPALPSWMGPGEASEVWVLHGGVPVARESFPGEPWAADLLRDQQDLPHVVEDERYGWRLDDLESEHLNTAYGRRVSTTVSDPEAKVWLFGGSTVFGVGQRDEHTIASELVAEAARHGRRVQVENLGVSAYVGTQEAQVFADLLESGERSDLAVFYDGCNEMALAWQRETYGLLDPDEDAVLTTTDDEREQRAAEAEDRGYRESHDGDRRADFVSVQYRRAVDRARRAGERHQVEVVHIWQPVLADLSDDQPMVSEVRERLDVDRGIQADERRVVDEAIERSGVDPVDLRDSLDDADVPVFFDFCHSNEAGARLQAQAIYAEIEGLLP